MSKVATSTSAPPLIRSGLGSTALAALVLLSPADTLAAGPEPALRPSEQVDVRRLGTVTEDDRAVLRVEWRAALTGADEARSVQQMLDSLRRMEDTTAQIGRLVRNIPPPKPTAVVVPAEPETDTRSLAMGAAAMAALLLPLFWFSRRKTAANPAGPARIDPPRAVLPEVAPGVEAAPAGSPPEQPAAGLPPTIDRPPEPEPPAAVEAPVEPENTAAPRDVRPAHDMAEVAPPAATARVAPVTPARPDQVEASKARPSEIPPIEFSLEEADPQAVARENERLLKRQAMSPLNRQVQPVESNVEPTLELAEIMLSMGLEQSAAQALVEFSEAHPRQALYHWLKLLDIYRRSGHRKDFKETAEKLRQNFNIQAEDWTRARRGEAPTFESFSRVAVHVQEVWRQPEECIAYLKHLLEDNREGSRAGFPQPVAEEILLLIEILKLTSCGAGQAAGLQRSTT